MLKVDKRFLAESTRGCQHDTKNDEVVQHKDRGSNLGQK